MTTINPATGELIRYYQETSPTEVDGILNAMDRAFKQWRTTDFRQRADLMKQVAKYLAQSKDTYATLIAREMGKPILQGRAEIEKCIWVCNYYSDHARQFLKPEVIKTDACRSFVTFDPLGVILAVMPWNFPFWQVFRFVVPALLAGNVCVLKHASNVSGCSLAIEGVFREAGFPEGVLRTLILPGSRVAEVIEHAVVKAVTLTGSTETGSAVAALAGRLMKKTVLELGGSDPYLVLEDADIEPTVESCVVSRLINSGQSCIAAKRFIVVESQRSDFEERIVEKFCDKIVGSPMDEVTDIGPLAREDLRTVLHNQIRESIRQGARCLCGGSIPTGKGFFYPPTVLTAVRKGMSAFDQELFGPVAAIVPVNNEREAISMANATSFGLGAAVFTRDRSRGESIAAKELEAGCCFVNDYVRSDPRLPFGGIKGSGYGRELAHYGIKEFVNIKTVYVK